MNWLLCCGLHVIDFETELLYLFKKRNGQKAPKLGNVTASFSVNNALMASKINEQPY